MKISSKTGSQQSRIWLILKAELFTVRALKFSCYILPSDKKSFSLFIASQRAVVQLAHFELILLVARTSYLNY